jgi:hypothetical protein
MGIGTGNTSRRTLGMPAAKLAELRTDIEVCRGLWKRETVVYEGDDRRQHIRFLDPDAELINLCDRIPVYIAARSVGSRAAQGPKVAAGALANRNVRVLWALLAKG